LSATTGGVVQFSLNPGVDHANRNYLILGTTSGTSPEYPLPGGLVSLPLNWDAFTEAMLLLLNTQVFDGFLGTLDENGEAAARIDVPPFDAVFVGLIMHYAFCLNNPFDFVSNTVELEIVI
ncbi:MAG: hypothetical protein KJ645_13640, partial [Planctomycetes bacterium]|nr:hypothetical protein [Planctomycetota bacterium]